MMKIAHFFIRDRTDLSCTIFAVLFSSINLTKDAIVHQNIRVPSFDFAIPTNSLSAVPKSRLADGVRGISSSGLFVLALLDAPEMTSRTKECAVSSISNDLSSVDRGLWPGLCGRSSDAERFRELMDVGVLWFLIPPTLD
jgi:hypothetical protein